MAADVGTDADTIRRFFAAAGVAQYTDKLKTVLLKFNDMLGDDAGAAGDGRGGGRGGGRGSGRGDAAGAGETAARWKSRRVQKDPRGVLDATARAAAEHARSAAQHAVDVADRDARLAARRGGS